jgi:hypothetical protein
MRRTKWRRWSRKRSSPRKATSRGGETAAENGEPEVAAARPGHVVIQPGNNLWRISRVIYGRGIEYTAIYEANRDKIRDPDLIYPGQIFATPGVDPPKEIDPRVARAAEPGRTWRARTRPSRRHPRRFAIGRGRS